MTKKSKLKHCEATWSTYFPDRHTFATYVGFRFWPLLVTDQWFLPRLCIHIQNQGETIPKAQVSVEIAETSSVATFSNYQGPFQDIKHFQFDDFLAGKVKKLKLTIPSKFLKPGSYMIRVTIRKFEPSPSMFDQIKESFFGKGTPTLESIKSFNTAIETFQTHSPNLNLHEIPVGQYRGILLCDWRLHEVLKVHSIAGPAGITAIIAIPAALLALVNLIGPLARFLYEHSPSVINTVHSFLGKIIT